MLALLAFLCNFKEFIVNMSFRFEINDTEEDSFELSHQFGKIP